MEKRPSQQLYVQEFQEFLAVREAEPPVSISENVLVRIQREMSPASWLVFSKLALIHWVVGTVTILFCPQFGISLTGGMGIMSFFMKFGEEICMIACGVVFMSGSALCGALFLRPEEVVTIRKKRYLQMASLALLSMGVFVCMGVGFLLSLALFWILGSVLGGLLGLEFGWIFRFKWARALGRSWS